MSSRSLDEFHKSCSVGVLIETGGGPFQGGTSSSRRNAERKKVKETMSQYWMGWDLAEWLERLTDNAVVATVLRSIPASSTTVESEGRQMKQCWTSYIKR